MRIHAFINYSVADLGTIEEWVNARNHTITWNNVYENSEFPALESFDMLIVLGGVMGAYEEEAYPWLVKEKHFIRNAIEANKFVFGICLGGQLIAEVLGGKVYPHQYQEIGWWDISFTDEVKKHPIFSNLPRQVTMFQFHGDTLELPEQATWLAKSDACQNQAFVYGDRVVGLQFHPEFNEEKLQEIVRIHGSEIEKGPFAQLPNQFLGKKERMKNAKKYLFRLLDNMEREYEKSD